MRVELGKYLRDGLLHEVAHLPHEAEGVAVQFLDGIGDGPGRLGVAGQEPDHQLFRGIMV